jgi:hypothetical protein
MNVGDDRNATPKPKLKKIVFLKLTGCYFFDIRA